MGSKEFRAALTIAEFEAISPEEDFVLHNYEEHLVFGNPKFKNIYNEFPRGCEDKGLRPYLTPGQRLLIQVAIFDGQVCNGGLTQFFWNYPEDIFEAYDAIKILDDQELLKNYERALEGLMGKKSDWLQLRNEWIGEQDTPQWEKFQKSYETLKIGWFDEAYYDKWGYNERKERVIVKPGLQKPFLLRMVAYIKTHSAEFIEE